MIHRWFHTVFPVQHILAAAVLTCLLPWKISAQADFSVTRILFVLDASGSMEGNWDGKSKFDVAKEILFQTLDSLEQNNGHLEFALRIFGFQTPKQLKNCEDSKLVCDFAPNNATAFRKVLRNIKNQGQTPIAYSLYQAVNDFPPDPQAKNVIVLITDGIETCEGDPCSVSSVLASRHIALRPFIIGLGMGENGSEYFDCLGTYYDASDEHSFENALNVVISQAMNNTTTQVNLLDIYGNPTETNVEITFYDHFTHRNVYSFVHSLDFYGQSDTLDISPVGVYDLTVHTTPPVVKRNIKLIPGKHNIISVPAPQGQLVLKISGSTGFATVPCVIRKAGSDEILDVQQFNTIKKLLVGYYDLEVLTLPRLEFKNVKIDQSKNTEITIPATGNLNLTAVRPGIVSVYIERNQTLERVIEIKNLNQPYGVRLQPGAYQVVYRPYGLRSSALTQTKSVVVYSKSTTTVRF